jgi:transposase InsO family protein
VYVGDITYIPTSEGWLYLATVIDLCSRRVVGWSMDAHMTAVLVNDALFMALKKRNPQSVSNSVDRSVQIDCWLMEKSRLFMTSILLWENSGW